MDSEWRRRKVRMGPVLVALLRRSEGVAEVDRLLTAMPAVSLSLVDAAAVKLKGDPEVARPLAVFRKHWWLFVAKDVPGVALFDETDYGIGPRGEYERHVGAGGDMLDPGTVYERFRGTDVIGERVSRPQSKSLRKGPRKADGKKKAA